MIRDLAIRFPNVQVVGNTINCSADGGIWEALGVIDFLVHTMRGIRTSTYFNGKDTQAGIYRALSSLEEPMPITGFDEIFNWDSALYRIQAGMEEDSDLFIRAFMLVRGVFFKIQGEIEGKYLRAGILQRHEEIDINLTDDGDGWRIHTSFPLDD